MGDFFNESYVSGWFEDKSGEKAAKATVKGAEISAEAREKALEYLKEREAVPQQFREGALYELGGLYGLEGGTGSQQELINRAIQSPLYQEIMGGRDAGEDAILRNAAATGGLRSGNVNTAMYDYDTRLQNQALLESYNQQLMGLQGLAGLPSMSPQIAETMAGIGDTRALGYTGAANAMQQGSQQNTQNMMALAGLAMKAYGMFSDRRLKKNIKKVGKINGFNWYSFNWNSVANKLGLSGSTYGCMADEVFEKVPDAVCMKNGFMWINYMMIGVL
jgi:hypothetical protein